MCIIVNMVILSFCSLYQYVSHMCREKISSLVIALSMTGETNAPRFRFLFLVDHKFVRLVPYGDVWGLCQFSSPSTSNRMQNQSSFGLDLSAIFFSFWSFVGLQYCAMTKCLGTHLLRRNMWRIRKKWTKKSKNVWMMGLIWSLLIFFNFFFIQKLTSIFQQYAGKFCIYICKIYQHIVQNVGNFLKKKKLNKSNNDYMNLLSKYFYRFAYIFLVRRKKCISLSLFFVKACFLVFDVRDHTSNYGLSIKSLTTKLRRRFFEKIKEAFYFVDSIFIRYHYVI